MVLISLLIQSFKLDLYNQVAVCLLHSIYYFSVRSRNNWLRYVISCDTEKLQSGPT